MLEAQPLRYTVACRGDLEAVAFIAERLEGAYTLLQSAGREHQVALEFPSERQKTANALHGAMIRDADGHCCWIRILDKT